MNYKKQLPLYDAHLENKISERYKSILKTNISSFYSMTIFYEETILPSMIVPLKRTRCSKRNCCISSCDEKLISRETARHLRIRFGTRASCSTSGSDLNINKKKCRKLSEK